jgi:hypothetical protein
MLAQSLNGPKVGLQQGRISCLQDSSNKDGTQVLCSALPFPEVFTKIFSHEAAILHAEEMLHIINKCLLMLTEFCQHGCNDFIETP